jgi:Transposase
MEKEVEPRSGVLEYVVNLPVVALFYWSVSTTGATMLYVGIDLHKKTITLCVVNQQRQAIRRRTLHCAEPANIRAYFSELGPFVAVVEATASYEWLWQLLEPLAERLVLAHPKKLQIIAESTRKSDQLDAAVALGAGGSGLASGAQQSALANDLRSTAEAARAEESDRGGRPAIVDRDGGAIAQRAMLPIRDVGGLVGKSPGVA